MRKNQNTEWKEAWRDEYMKWISGFANAEGGVLVIGRNDKGEVVGLTKAAKLLEDIPNKVRDILGIMVNVNLQEESGREFLEIVVEPYPYPVSYKGEYHIRSGSTKQELKGAALDKFLLRKQGLRWDGVPVPGVSVRSLTRQTLKLFRERAARSKRLDREVLKESDAGLVDKLHLKDGRYLKRAALLLFHPDPERFVTGAYIKIGRFRSNSDLLYHDEIHGDLFTQVEKTMDLLLTKYLHAAISYEGIQRVETYPVPDEALREALLNAVAHKDYGSGVPIQISVHDDKILFWNNGELHPGWTVNTLTQKHSSQPFNPDIANAFFRAGMIESWGRGIERIIDACRTAGVPLPKLRYEGAGLWVEFPCRVGTTETREEADQGKTGQVTAHDTEHDTAHDTEHVSEELLRLLAVLEGEMKRADIQSALGLQHREYFRSAYLKPSLMKNLIEMTIPDKPKSKLQKYRLTAKGKAVLRAASKKEQAGPTS